MTTHAGDDPFEALEKLEPLIRGHAAEAERCRRLSTAVVEALRDAGFYRLFRPAARGGRELDPVTEFRLAEALARIDSAAAWNVQVCNASELWGGWFDEATTTQVFGAPDAIVAGSFFPRRRATRVDGGYRLCGRTPFNSNCQGATWLLGTAEVIDGDTPRLDADGRPQLLLTAVPMRDAAIHENWETLGMCGTGSHDVEIDDLFVPDARAVPFGPLDTPSPAYATPLTPLAVWATVGAHAAVALGVGQAALDALAGLGTKVPAYTAHMLRDRARVQLRVARAEALLCAARAFFHQAYAEAFAASCRHRRLTLDQRARCQLAATHVAQSAAEAVDLVHSCVGTHGIRNGQVFERCFRDAHVITQHAFLSDARLEDVGQIRLGLEPDWPFFAF